MSRRGSAGGGEDVECSGALGRLLLQGLEKSVQGSAVDVARDENAVLDIERGQDRLPGIGVVCDPIAELLALLAQVGPQVKPCCSCTSL